MKKKKLFILIPIILAVAVLLLGGAYELIYYEIIIKPSVVHSEIKSIDLTTTYEIEIKNNGKTIGLSPEEDKYKAVCEALDGKRVKIKSDRVYFWDDENYRIEIKTETQSYILYGCPEIISDEDGETLSEQIVFVLYDYTNNDTMKYLYQIVTVSKSDFLKIFPDFQES